MRFEAAKRQTSYGEAIGILMLDTFCPFIQGDVGNAASFHYPVRFKRIDGLTVERIFAHDLGFVEKMIAGARELEREGVRAITGDCGFMAIYQKEVKESVNIPVFFSSLLQIPFNKYIHHGIDQLQIVAKRHSKIHHGHRVDCVEHAKRTQPGINRKVRVMIFFHKSLGRIIIAVVMGVGQYDFV